MESYGRNLKKCIWDDCKYLKILRIKEAIGALNEVKFLTQNVDIWHFQHFARKSNS